MTQVATFLVILGMLGLFWLDRDPKVRTSPALWIPVLWLGIAGSRPLSVWLQIDAGSARTDQFTEGSPFDRNFWLALVIANLFVVIQRRKSVWRLVRANALPFLFLAYCALSIAWSDFPDIAFKRWIKFLGDYMVVLVILTDPAPAMALKRVLGRVAFVLLPLSLLFIKYYPQLGRAYAQHWTATQFYTGVAQDKNMLGMTCLVFGFGGGWQLLHELAGKNRVRHLLVYGTVFGLALWLLIVCNSMTSLSCLVLVTLLTASQVFFRSARRPAVIRLMTTVIILICFAPLFLGMFGGVFDSLGRDATLSGRTQLWADVLAIPVNRLVGTGFESFWLGSRLDQIWQLYWWQPIEAHNGYIETYLNLGIVGIALLAALILSGYRRIMALLRVDPEAGRIRLGFLVAAIVYNFTEAAIHTLSLIWIFLLLSVIQLPAVRQPMAAGTSSNREPESTSIDWDVVPAGPGTI
jgi:exopolysaccharide production protein ExoQ